MSKNQITNVTNQSTAILLSNLIDADTKVEQQINNYIQYFGVTNFFSKLDTLEFSAEITEKLNAVKAILDVAFVDVVKEADIHV